MKTAWIFPGGSARSVYTAGMMHALCSLDERPDMVIACSGSAPTSLCYPAHRQGIIRKVWGSSANR